MDRSNLLIVVVCLPVAFFLGVIVARIFPDGDPKLLIDLGIAIGTIGAVTVALMQGASSRKEARSLSYRTAAVEHLRSAANRFLERPDAYGRPRNTRRHWLNFARAIQVAKQLSSRIELEDQVEIWREQENIVRQEIFDVLNSPQYRLDKDYFWPPQSMNPKKSREISIAEQSLVVIYRWVDWPTDRPDPIDKNLRFTDDERNGALLFGIDGVTDFLDERRPTK